MSIPSSGSSTARSASITSSRVGIRRSRVSRQAVLRELVPRRTRVDEGVVLRPDLRVAVQRAEPDRDLLPLGPVSPEERRAADRAERLHRGEGVLLGLRLVALRGLLAQGGGDLDPARLAGRRPGDPAAVPLLRRLACAVGRAPGGRPASIPWTA